MTTVLEVKKFLATASMMVAAGQPANLTPAQIYAIVDVWDELDEKIRQLTLATFPQVAAQQLNETLRDVFIDMSMKTS